jgi:DNA-binding Lrp family transcriptional regulator
MTPFDQSVLAYYQRHGGATAWICASALQVDREEVSKALQRLKRKGVMKNKGPFWEWKAPSRQEVGYE